MNRKIIPRTLLGLTLITVATLWLGSSSANAAYPDHIVFNDAYMSNTAGMGLPVPYVTNHFTLTLVDSNGAPTGGVLFVSPSNALAGSGAMFWMLNNYLGTATLTMRSSAVTNSPILAQTNFTITNALAPVTSLEIRFYNSSSNAASNVFILPYAGPGGDFWWFTNGTKTTNVWSSNIKKTHNQTVALSEITISGTNNNGQPYYSIFTTNFNNAAWFISYGGGQVSTNLTQGGVAQPSPGAGLIWTNAPWSPVELTLDGNSADLADTTAINDFAIPILLRNHRDNGLGTNYAQSTGWTNQNPLDLFITMDDLRGDFPLAILYATNNGKTRPLMIVGANSGGLGSLRVTPSATNANSYPLFTSYFNYIRTNSNVNCNSNWIKDSISYTNVTTNWTYAYNFKLSVTSSNSIKLLGSVVATNNINSTRSSNSNLTIEIAPDQGAPTNDTEWASTFVYLGGTPANYAFQSNSFVTNGPVINTITNDVVLTNVLMLSTNWSNVASQTGWPLPSGTNVATNTYKFWNSPIATTVIGRVMGDAAAGFALGFIGSDVKNPYYSNGTVDFGNCPSGAWWGGSEYPNANSNTLMLSDVQTNPNVAFYDLYCDDIGRATRYIYTHPIYDRMQAYANVQIACATNQPAPGIRVIDVEMFNSIGLETNSPNRLSVGQSLKTGQSLMSGNKNYILTLQGDGALVLYGTNGPLWSTVHGNFDTKTPYQGGYTNTARGTNLLMQADGNLVLIGNNGKTNWATGTVGQSNYLGLGNNNGIFGVINSNNVLIWSRFTGPAK